MSTQPAASTQPQPNPKSTDPEAVRRVLSVREPVKAAKAPATAAIKPPAR